MSWIASLLTYPQGLRERRTPVLYATQSTCPDDSACSSSVLSGVEGRRFCKVDGNNACKSACSRPEIKQKVCKTLIGKLKKTDLCRHPQK